MAVITALESLYAKVAAQFAADNLKVAMSFGWREAPKQLTPAPRIVWVPGDPAGNLGEITGPKYPGSTSPYMDQPGPGGTATRPLGMIWELFYCDLTGENTTQPDNEQFQYNATRQLLDSWARAVYLSAHGTYRYVSSEWRIDKSERRRGATVRVVAAIQAVIPDLVNPTVPADTSADVTTNLLDQSELEIINVNS